MISQLATNTLERVAPLTHAVGNVLKRVFVIGFSIIVFGNSLYFVCFLVSIAAKEVTKSVVINWP